MNILLKCKIVNHPMKYGNAIKYVYRRVKLYFTNKYIGIFYFSYFTLLCYIIPNIINICISRCDEKFEVKNTAI